MLLRRRPGRPTHDRLHEAAVIPAPLHLQGELGVDVSPDEHLAGGAAQAAEVDILRECTRDGPLDFTLDRVILMIFICLGRNRI